MNILKRYSIADSIAFSKEKKHLNCKQTKSTAFALKLLDQMKLIEEFEFQKYFADWVLTLCILSY